MADHSRDRVEAAAKACFEHDRADTNWSATYDEMAPADRDLYLTDARRALAAVDEFDRVAGVVRVDTRDNEAGRVIYQLLHEAWASPGDVPLDEVARRVLAALGAAGVGEQQGGQADG